MKNNLEKTEIKVEIDRS